MRSQSPRPVIVGIEGSITDTWAIRVAALEAAARGSPLVIASVADQARMSYCLAQARRVVAAIAPGVPIGDVGDYAGASALVELSIEAAAVVVGRPDTVGLENLVAASVAHQAATYAWCSVLVVPELLEPFEARRPGQALTSGLGVVLGLDVGASAEAAVGFAFDQAARRGLPLTAVRARGPVTDDPDQFDAGEDRVVSEVLARWREKYPDVTVNYQDHRWQAAGILVEASRIADLVVVGARGSGGFENLRLGSVSDAVMRHASCTVAIVR
jgi:nucleotide-binding universal stress UspA family protein